MAEPKKEARPRRDLRRLVCAQCLGDTYLGAAIDHDSGDRVCSFCKNVRAVADLSAVVKLADKALSQTVHRVARRPGERSDARSNSFNTAHPFAELIKVNLRKAAPGFARCISDRLIEIGNARRAKGAVHAWSGRHRYAVNTLALPLKTVEEQWQRYRSAVERGGRFFNQDAKSFLDDLFAPLDRRDVNPSVLQPALVLGEIYRARLANTPPEVEVIRKKPAQQLGPPPPALAKTGRMNAERIAVFYGAFNVKTAIAEIRPSIGTTVVTGLFKVDRPVRCLNMSALVFKSWATISIWDPKFQHRRLMRALLHRLHERVARPVVPGAENEYLATQFLAEYLSVHKKIEAVVFDSVQHKGGKNVVLLSSLLGDFSDRQKAYTKSRVKFLPSTVHVHAVKGVDYETENPDRQQNLLFEDK